jgi:hypothetical protein
MSERPERFGDLYSEERKRLGGLLRTADDTAARRAARDAAPLGREAYEARDQLVHATVAARERRLSAEFSAELALVYREPSTAHHGYNEVLAEHGPAQATKVLARKPELLGELRVSNGHDTGDARSHAKRAAEIGNEVATVWQRSDARGRATTPKAEHDVAVAEVHRVDAWVKTLRMERDRLPQRSVLERRIGIALSTLAPREVKQLRALLNGPQFALASELRAKVKDLLLGRDQGVER